MTDLRKDVVLAVKVQGILQHVVPEGVTIQITVGANLLGREWEQGKEDSLESQKLIGWNEEV